jgi:glycosyltransferase involved in cell wall biosynthesis
MSIDLPLVSVIVPAYNRAGFILDALASAYDQDYSPMEVVVVDDGSTDDTRDVVESFECPVRYVYQEHAGVSPARNRGLAEAKGELIAFLDSDDVWTAGSLLYRVRQLMENPHAEVAYGKTRVTNLVEGGKLRRYRDGEASHHPCFSSMLIRRSAFDKIGAVDESFEHSEDIDWVCRAKEGGIAILRTDFVVLNYRIHGGNMTSDVDTNRGFMFRALKKSLERRREGGDS